MHTGSPHTQVDGGSPATDAAAVGASADVTTTAKTPAKNRAGKLFTVSQRTSSLLGIQIVACGSYVPETIWIADARRNAD